MKIGFVGVTETDEGGNGDVVTQQEKQNQIFSRSHTGHLQSVHDKICLRLIVKRY